MRPTPTLRELQVLAAVLQVGVKGGADHLGISERGVKHHLTNVYRRLDVYGRVDAADRLGWLVIPPELRIVTHEPVPAASPLAIQLADAVLAYVDGISHQMRRTGRTLGRETEPSSTRAGALLLGQESAPARRGPERTTT